MPGQGNKIVVGDYNAIQTVIGNVMGAVPTTTSNYGYGQPVASSQISGPNYGKVTAIQWNYLQYDIDRAYIHTTGSPAGLNVASNGAGYSITSATSDGSYWTINTTPYPASSGWPTGMVVQIAGASNSGYNSQNLSIIGAGTTQFKIASTTSPGATIGLPYTITSITSTSTTITVNTSAFPTIWPTGMSVTISGVTPAAYNGTWTITGVSTTKFTIASALNPGLSIGTGTVLATPVVITPTVKIKETDRAAYLTAANYCNTHYIDIPNSLQAASISLSTANKIPPWNGTFTHTVTLTFPSRAGAQYFFNTGSQLQISASLTDYPPVDASTAKNTDWHDMLNALGIIKIGANYTSCTGSYSSIAAGTGFYQLTTTPTLLLQKITSAPAYTNNQYDVYASIDATGKIVTLSIQFQDNSTGHGGADENITGTANSYVTAYYAYTAPRNIGVDVTSYLPTVS